MKRFLTYLSVAICIIFASSVSYATDYCLNLFDASTVLDQNAYVVSSGGYLNQPSNNTYWRHSDYIEIEPSTTYKISGITFAGASAAGMAWYKQSKTYISGMNSTNMGAVNGVITSPENAKYLRFSWNITQNPNWANTLRLERDNCSVCDGTVVVENGESQCVVQKIKIATTAYNSAQFNPVVTDLNSTVATIREIVTKTINQTAAIASLQADKQTRPEDACPAGKKCLLVETEENGVIVPHWYPIIESAD